MRLDAILSSLDLLSSLSVANAESMLRRKKGVNNMKIKILSLANGLNEILNLHLDRLGLKQKQLITANQSYHKLKRQIYSSTV
jgi:hypothetical protein